jgi:hypothetical protein
MPINTDDPDRSIYESQEAAEAAKGLGQQLKETAKSFVGLQEATGRSLSAEEKKGAAWVNLKNNAKQLGRELGNLSFSAGNSVRSMSDMTGTATAGLNVVGGVALMFGPLGKAVAVVTKVFGVLYAKAADQMDKQFDASKALGKSGAVFQSFNNSLTDLGGSMGYGRNEFSKLAAVVQKNAFTFSILGGSVTAGSEEFRKLITTTRTSADLLKMGFGGDEINEAVGTYLTLLTRSNRAELTKSIREGRFQNDFQKYARNLREVSALTGANADELRASQEELNNDTRFRAYIREVELTQGKDSAQAMRELYAGLKELDPGFASGLADLVATGGAPISEAGQQVYRALGGSAEAMELISDNSKSVGEKIQALGSMVEPTRDQFTGLAKLDPEAFTKVYGSFVGMDNIVLTTTQKLGKLNEQIDKSGEGDAAAGRIKIEQQNIEALRASLRMTNNLTGASTAFGKALSFAEMKVTQFGEFLSSGIWGASKTRGKIIEELSELQAEEAAGEDDWYVPYTDIGKRSKQIEDLKLKLEKLNETEGMAEGSLKTTGELFPDWGDGTLTPLHGQEAVVPKTSTYGQILSAIDDGNLISQLQGTNDKADSFSQLGQLSPNVQQNTDQQVFNNEAVAELTQQQNIQIRLLKEINGHLANVHGSLS